MKKSTQIRLAAIAAGSLVAGSVFAVTPYDTIIASASFTEATTGILSVFGVMAALYVAVKGGKLILAAIKGG